jgi:hypothetical protein
MTEAEARTLLIKAGYEDLDPWIATQPWQPTPTGWWVVPAQRGWFFRVEVAGAGRLRITANTAGGAPTVWMVPRKAR